MCPEKIESFFNVSLTRNTISDRISSHAADANGQHKEKLETFVAISVAIDENTDITDIAQLAVFIRGVDADLTVTEEFAQFAPMTGMTKAEEIFG